MSRSLCTWMRFLLCLLAAMVVVGCGADVAALTQRAYVWQRDWTSAVEASVTHPITRQLDGLVILAAEVEWDHAEAKPVFAQWNRTTLRDSGAQIGLALRIAPFAGPFSEDGPVVDVLKQTVLKVLRELEQGGIICAEVQIDFDCAQKKLDGYANWLRGLGDVIHPRRMVITTLPTWLEEPAFERLLREVDGFVLQVHSVPPSVPRTEALVCEPDRARRWIAAAAKYGVPFEVALSTYSALAGYDESGKLLGVAMDGPPPAWPRGSRLMHLNSSPEELQSLVNEWRAHRPPNLSGVIWYRLPVASDRRNWNLHCFGKVIRGEPITRDLKVVVSETNPHDLILRNDGDAEDTWQQTVRVTWDDAPPVGVDALRGWTLRTVEGAVEFLPREPLHLPAGSKSVIGWLRFDQRASLHVEMLP
ncbi:MAG: DUF3142 domain-containing protein [Verrucomicrobiales bacterium]|nr:DUF3142 domain-containing protein [Verrucomicrobiales bacterium]MCP5558512.1 DUF3142 domain-containing protein [Verrucomicrobiaceae bacterium]